MVSQPEIETAKHESVWADTAEMPNYPPLQECPRADICIVGAGIAGLTTAYLLTQAGKSVVVLDDGPLAGGATKVTTAHLSNAIDDRYFEIERLHGQRGAQLTAESHTAAIDRIGSIAQQENIDCDFERLDGYLFLAPGEKEEVLDRELAATKRAGLTEVEKLVYAPLSSFDTGPCLRFPNQGQFHPLKYLAGLAKAIERDDGRLFTQTHADQIDGGAPARIKVGSHIITADAVVVATNTPVNDLVAIHTKQAPFMTYVIAARVPRGSVTKAAVLGHSGPLSLSPTSKPDERERQRRRKRRGFADCGGRRPQDGASERYRPKACSAGSVGAKTLPDDGTH